jgi:methylase of polypeptide subunit release factors
VVKDFIKAKNSKDFVTLAHIQRYEWCSTFIKGIVLDAGCGSGYGTFFLAKYSNIKAIVGVDISFQAINFAR